MRLVSLCLDLLAQSWRWETFVESPPRRRTHPILSLAFRLLIITAYSLCVLWFFFDGREWRTFAQMQVTPDGVAAGAVGALLWSYLAIHFIRGLLRSDSRRDYLKAHVGVPLLLVSVLFTYVVWLPAIALVLIVLGFMFELPRHPNSKELMTAFALIAFISAIVTIGLVRVERFDPDSQLRSLGDGLSWTTARLLLSGEMGIDTMEAIQPHTADGRSLATVLALCATLFAALFIGAVVAWLTNPDEHRTDAADPAGRGCGNSSSRARQTNQRRINLGQKMIRPLKSARNTLAGNG